MRTPPHPGALICFDVYRRWKQSRAELEEIRQKRRERWRERGPDQEGWLKHTHTHTQIFTVSEFHTDVCVDLLICCCRNSLSISTISGCRPHHHLLVDRVCGHVVSQETVHVVRACASTCTCVASSYRRFNHGSKVFSAALRCSQR